jgi:hypothetical protein
MRRGAISIEWKTLYAFDSNLFSLVADARVGVHGHVDVRKYFVKGGHRAVDAQLVSRTVKVLLEALRLQREGRQLTESGGKVSFAFTKMVSGVGKEAVKDMAVRFPDEYDESTAMHVLGPLQNNHSQVCYAMPFREMRAFLGILEKESFHCDICRTYVVRRLLEI